MFHFSGCSIPITRDNRVFSAIGFPHSEIAGSKVARHLPDAYRRHATSFIAFQNLGIHHMLLIYPHTYFRLEHRSNTYPYIYKTDTILYSILRF